MKKGMRNLCNGDTSTSTLNQQNNSALAAATCPLPNLNLDTDIDIDHNSSAEKSSSSNPNSTGAAAAPAPTLEEMILKLEMEEANARQAKMIKKYCKGREGRMSCVNSNNIISNSSDILLSARNALNQYPRFSLDGKDAMYRSSFRNSDDTIKPSRKSVCCDFRSGSKLLMQQHPPIDHDYLQYSSSSSAAKLVPITTATTTTTLAGERVKWCKPGVVAKLMGLDAMPVPVPVKLNTKEKLSSLLKTHNLVRTRAQRQPMQTATATVADDHRTGWPSTHPYFF